MIVLDTHIWIWWVDSPALLSAPQRDAIAEQQNNAEGVIGICATSLWEVAKLAELGRISLNYDLATWLEGGLAYPRVQVINLTPAIAIASTELPGGFPRDPSDQIITATAIVHNCPLVTSDDAIRNHAAEVAIIY